MTYRTDHQTTVMTTDDDMCQQKNRRRWEKERVKFIKKKHQVPVRASGSQKIRSAEGLKEELDLRGRLCCPEEPVVPFEIQLAGGQ